MTMPEAPTPVRVPRVPDIRALATDALERGARTAIRAWLHGWRRVRVLRERERVLHVFGDA